MERYETGKYSCKIVKVIADKETDKTVWINGRKSSKKSANAMIHDSWIDAHSYLLERETKRVEAIRRSLEIANSSLGNVKGMVEPD